MCPSWMSVLPTLWGHRGAEALGLGRSWPGEAEGGVEGGWPCLVDQRVDLDLTWREEEEGRRGGASLVLSAGAQQQTAPVPQGPWFLCETVPYDSRKEREGGPASDRAWALWE